MSSSNGRPYESGKGIVVVRVADHVNQALTGHPGRQYESPPQSREQALTLVDLLFGRENGSVEARGEWSCAIAGGRRNITLVPLDWDHDARE